MRRRARRIAAVVLALVVLHGTAEARLELTSDERWLVDWSRKAAPATIHEEVMARVDIAEELAGRALVLARCPPPSVNTLLDPRYSTLIRRAIDATRGDITSVDIPGAIETNWQAAMIFAFRSWDEDKRGKWLMYLQSPEARVGFAWDRAVESVRTAEPVDLASGTERLVGLFRLRYLLEATGLVDRFAAAANTRATGLGDGFVRETSLSLRDRDLMDRESVLIPLARAIADNIDEIADAMRLAADPAQAEAARRWSEHSITAEIEALVLAFFVVRGGGAPVPGVNVTPQIVAFANAAGRGAYPFDDILRSLMLDATAACASPR